MNKRLLLLIIAISVLLKCFCQEKPTKHQTVQWLNEHLSSANFTTKECNNCDDKKYSQGFNAEIRLFDLKIKNDSICFIITRNETHRKFYSDITIRYKIYIPGITNVTIANYYKDWTGILEVYQDPVLIIKTKEQNICYSMKHVSYENTGQLLDKDDDGDNWGRDKIVCIPIDWDNEVNLRDRVLKAFARLIEINNENDNLFR